MYRARGPSFDSRAARAAQDEGGVDCAPGSATLDARFPGQWLQFETGLNYNWRRHYDPSLGRYLQPDPLGLASLLADGPSLYGYARQSPLVNVDPTGLAVGDGSGDLACVKFGVFSAACDLLPPCDQGADAGPGGPAGPSDQGGDPGGSTLSAGAGGPAGIGLGEPQGEPQPQKVGWFTNLCVGVWTVVCNWSGFGGEAIGVPPEMIPEPPPIERPQQHYKEPPPPPPNK